MWLGIIEELWILVYTSPAVNHFFSSSTFVIGFGQFNFWAFEKRC
jgi:hypothetical protein